MRIPNLVVHLIVLMPLALASCATAQHERVQYIVDLSRPQTQLVDITMVIRDGPPEPLEVRLPVWRPGRYAINDHAGAVQEVRASTPDGTTLPIEKTDKATWRIDPRGAEEVRIAYTVFCNEARLRTRHVDDTHAFLDASATMMYSPALRDEPIRVSIHAPDHWRIATGLETAPDDPRSVLAPNYDILVDSPLEIGEHDLIEFEVDGVPHEIVIWGRGDWHQRSLADDFAAIVRTQADIFGHMPYTRYVFMIHCQPGFGGGTEHINSTIMGARPESFESDDAYEGFLGLVSHEMFHTWNVKHLRPAGIVPYDYQKENYTDLLWFAEGTTSYYDDLTLARCGLIDIDEYLDRLSSQIRSVRSTPGRRVQSLSESSFDAWIKFNRRNEHSHNSSVNFYSQGALVSILLDLDLRNRTGGKVTLDRVLREMDERFPLEAGGFTSDDLVRTISEMSGHDYRAFFDRFVDGTDPYPLEEALKLIGLELVRDGDEDEETRAYLGLSLRDVGGLAEVSRINADGPAFDAGLNVGDRIVALDGVALGADDLDDRLDKHQAGDTIVFTLLRHGVLREIPVTLAERPAGKWTVRRVEDPSDDQKQAFEAWIHQPWDAGEGDDS